MSQPPRPRIETRSPVRPSGRVGRPVPEVLGEYEDHPGLGVSLVVFGTSGHEERPAGPVIANYVMREDATRVIGKSIVDPHRAVECISAHHFRYMQRIWPGIWAEVPAVDEQHRELTYKEPASVEKLRINHYYFKSEREAAEKFKQDYRAFGRPTDDLRSARLRNQRILEFRHLANAVKDTDIQMYLPSLREALNQRERSGRTGRSRPAIRAGSDDAGRPTSHPVHS